MSVEKLKQLKLYKKLEKDLSYREKLEKKIKQISNAQSSHSTSEVTKKLNGNKKYFQQQQRNAQIERQNRILFQKIQSHGMRSQYNSKRNSRIRSSKTLNSMQEYETLQQRPNKNHSQNKIHYQQEQSRVSFQENEEMMRPKPKQVRKSKLVTELTPEVLQLFRSRMVESAVKEQETVLFQGIAEIDGIRFKVKIIIKNKTYILSGKNKHTEIMLKMELNEYRKFHKQVLMGNPSSIFQYLLIDKGQIRFRTIQQQQSENEKVSNKMYKIQQEQDQQQQQYSRKQKKKPSQAHHHHRQQYKFLQQKYKNFPYYQQQAKTQPMKHYKKSRSNQRFVNKKQNLISNSNHSQKPNYERYRTLEDYINDKTDNYGHSPYVKGFNSGQSTQIDAKNVKNKYKLPYL